MNNQRSFSLIVIALIVVALLAGGVLAWQYFGTPKEEAEVPEDETAGWKTYRNEEYGLMVNYPSNINMRWEGRSYDAPSCPGIYSIYFSSQEKIKLPGGEQDVMEVAITSCPELGLGYTLSDIGFGRLGDFYAIPPFIEENIIVDNQSATKVTWTFSGKRLLSSYKALEIIIFIPREEGYYKIKTEINFEKQDIYLPIFNQMLSTFRFLE